MRPKIISDQKSKNVQVAMITDPLLKLYHNKNLPEKATEFGNNAF